MLVFSSVFEIYRMSISIAVILAHFIYMSFFYKRIILIEEFDKQLITK